MINENKFNKLLLVDGSYMLHRSLHVPEVFNLRASNGEGTGGIYGTLRTLLSELKINREYYPVICFDSGLSERRTNVDNKYKHFDERQAKELVEPENVEKDEYLTEYRTQRNKLMRILYYFGVPSLRYRNWEGDDLIYILSKVAKDSIVLTDDRDMLQLLSDKCRVRRPMANEIWTLDEFLEDRDFHNIYEFIMWKALNGDGSDNIPTSIKGVGDKFMGEFIKLINLHRNGTDYADLERYPYDPKQLQELCFNNDIKYRKAYINFDKQRFLINLELVDLNKVEVVPEIFESMVETITNSPEHTNYFSVLKLLGNLEIKEFDVDSLMESVAGRTSNLLLG